MKLETVVFNSDVVNDNDHIYSPYRQANFFELIKYPLYDNIPLTHSIRGMVKELGKECLFPTVVFIPLLRYSEAIQQEDVPTVMSRMTLHDVCTQEGLQYIVMTPDSLKGNVNVI